jgi:hypothetical protein
VLTGAALASKLGGLSAVLAKGAQIPLAAGVACTVASGKALLLTGLVLAWAALLATAEAGGPLTVIQDCTRR